MMAKTTVVLDSDSPYITVEIEENGVTRVKTIVVGTLCRQLVANTRLTGLRTGVLPPGFLSLRSDSGGLRFLMLCPQTRCDFPYHSTVYPDFPLPRLVVGGTLQDDRIADFRMGVIAEETPTPQTAMYRYPFSNVTESGSLCVGANTFRGYHSLWKLRTLPHRLLSIPNNDDRYSAEATRLKLPYRELLEHLKDKDTAYYYEHVLIPNGKTLQDFIE